MYIYIYIYIGIWDTGHGHGTRDRTWDTYIYIYPYKCIHCTSYAMDPWAIGGSPQGPLEPMGLFGDRPMAQGSMA